jgi:hypothetical protein
MGSLYRNPKNIKNHFCRILIDFLSFSVNFFLRVVLSTSLLSPKPQIILFRELVSIVKKKKYVLLLLVDKSQ